MNMLNSAKARNRQPAIDLEKLLGHGALHTGLYLAHGGAGLETEAVLPFVRLLEKEARTPFGCTCACTNTVGSLTWIDVNDSFDRGRVALEALKAGLSARRVLRALNVVTASGTDDLLSRLRSVQQAQRPSGRRGAVRTPVIIISDAMRPFYSSLLREGEAHRKFREFCLTLLRLKQRATVILLIKDQLVPYDRRYFLPELLRWQHERLTVMRDEFRTQAVVGRAG